MKNIFYDYENRKKVTPIYQVEAGEILEEYMQSKKIVVQIHAFFLDVLDELIEYINQIPFAFDVYISTDTPEKKVEIINTYANKIKAKKVVVENYENRGRDVLPFLLQLQPVIEQFDYICHLHTKKSETINWGDAWRRHLCNNLLGNEDYVREIFNKFYERESLGIVIQEVYPVLQLAADWGQTKPDVEMLLKDMQLNVDLPQHPIFSAGTMFWAKVDAVLPIFKLDWNNYDFPDEDGQLNFTLAHAIERIWVYLAKGLNYDYEIFQNELEAPIKKQKKRCTIFTLTDSRYPEVDSYLIQDLKETTDALIIIGNTVQADVISEKKQPLSMLQDVLLQRGLNSFTIFDEVVLISNTLFGSTKGLQTMFSYYDENDFHASSLYAKKMMVQSREEIILNSDFLIIKASDTMLDLIQRLNLSYDKTDDEITFAKTLREKGLKSNVYVVESIYMGEILDNRECLQTLPYEYTILNAPFLLKETFTRLTNASFDAVTEYFSRLPKGKRFVKYFKLIKEEQIQVIPKRNFFSRMCSFILRKLRCVKRKLKKLIK